MAIRSVYEIDLSSFKELEKITQKHQAAVKSMPKAWQQVNTEVDSLKESIDNLADEMAWSRISADGIVKAQERSDRLTRSAESRWSSMARSTKDFARNIGEATVSLLRWASITSVGLGLGTGAGLFGLDRLGLAAGGQRKGALGLRANIGEQEAFGVTFRRLLGDPEGTFASIAHARGDINQLAGLKAAGLTSDELQGSTGKVAAAFLTKFSEKVQGWNPQAITQFLEAFKLSGIVSLEDVNRIQGTPKAERAGLAAQLAGRVSDYALDPKDAKAWQDFTQRLEDAGQSIEATLKRGLAPLAGPFGELSTATQKLIQTFLESDTLKGWVTDLSGALKEFAGYIGKPEFKTDVETFIAGVGSLASSIASVAKWFVPSKPDPNMVWVDDGIGGYMAPRKSVEAGKGRLIGDTTGMNPEFVKRLQAMAAGEGDIHLTSGFRTAEQQAALRRYNPSGYPVSKGTSEHQLGTAADIKETYMKSAAGRYGLEFNAANDPVHVHLKKIAENTKGDPYEAGAKPVRFTVQTPVGGDVAVSVNGLAAKQ